MIEGEEFAGRRGSYRRHYSAVDLEKGIELYKVSCTFTCVRSSFLWDIHIRALLRPCLLNWAGAEYVLNVER